MLINFFRAILRIFFRKITLEGLENLPGSGPVIFAPNHPNALVDPLLLFLLPSRYRIRFVAKAPLFKIPLLGWLMTRMGVIPVVRRMDAQGQVDYRTFFGACLDALKAGECIAIFPEGISLPQPHMAQVRTGAVRLFFLAREQGLQVPIIPVGINYEYGSIFRTPVMVSFGESLATAPQWAGQDGNPREAVQGLTRDLAEALDQLVFQADDHRDRELILLLERIYRADADSGAWPQRLSRLKAFAAGLKALRRSHPKKIRRLRHLLVRYQQSNQLLGGTAPPAGRSAGRPALGRRLMALAALPLALIGWGFCFIPYQLCRLMVTRVKQCDEAAAATYKILYGLLFFPLAFIVEGVLIHAGLGGAYSLAFALFIGPLSYFCLRYFEWLADQQAGLWVPGGKFRQTIRAGGIKTLSAQHRQIQTLVDELYTCYQPKIGG